MQIGRIEKATRVLGREQGFTPLPVRDELVIDDEGGTFPIMASAWLPNPAELAALNAGAAVHVRMAGTYHPPMTVVTGPVPE